MKRFFFFFLAAGISVVLLAQRESQYLNANFNLYSGDLLKLYNELAVSKSMRMIKEADYDGSPYRNENFLPGALITYDSIEYQGLRLRYNAFNDEMEFLKDDIPYHFNKNIDILLVSLGTSTFVNKGDGKEGGLKGYYEVLSAGRFNLLAKRKIKFNPPKPASGYQSYKRASFKKIKSEYYVQEGLNGEVKQINNMESLLEALGQERDKLKDFIKTKKLKFRREKDIQEIVRFYNRLRK